MRLLEDPGVISGDYDRGVELLELAQSPKPKKGWAETLDAVSAANAFAIAERWRGGTDAVVDEDGVVAAAAGSLGALDVDLVGCSEVAEVGDASGMHHGATDVID